MTTEAIDAKKSKEATKFDTAKKIRQLLDKAREDYGEDAWDEAEIETEVMELVTGEDD